MLHLTIQSLDGTQYDGPAKQVTIPTQSGQITILPGHQPLVTISKPGIIKIIPPELDESLLGRYIITDKIINLSVTQGIVQIQDNMITILTSQATSSPSESLELLEENKKILTAKLAEISMTQNSDNYEDILTEIQKIDADIKLSLLK